MLLGTQTELLKPSTENNKRGRKGGEAGGKGVSRRHGKEELSMTNSECGEDHEGGNQGVSEKTCPKDK